MLDKSDVHQVEPILSLFFSKNPTVRMSDEKKGHVHVWTPNKEWSPWQSWRGEKKAKYLCWNIRIDCTICGCYVVIDADQKNAFIKSDVPPNQ